MKGDEETPSLVPEAYFWVDLVDRKGAQHPTQLVVRRRHTAILSALRFVGAIAERDRRGLNSFGGHKGSSTSEVVFGWRHTAIMPALRFVGAMARRVVMGW